MSGSRKPKDKRAPARPPSGSTRGAGRAPEAPAKSGAPAKPGATGKAGAPAARKPVAGKSTGGARVGGRPGAHRKPTRAPVPVRPVGPYDETKGLRADDVIGRFFDLDADDVPDTSVPAGPQQPAWELVVQDGNGDPDAWAGDAYRPTDAELAELAASQTETDEGEEEDEYGVYDDEAYDDTASSDTDGDEDEDDEGYDDDALLDLDGEEIDEDTNPFDPDSEDPRERVRARLWEEARLPEVAVADFNPDELELERGIPLIAIVGRPNVGKSRLFNRMTGTRFAIVEDMPGVTRDRQYGDGAWDMHRFQVVDTGGFEPESADVLLKQMREQARLAIEEADIIFFVMDGPAGLMAADREIATMLRQSRKPVYAIVNKLDGDRHDALTAEFWELGFQEIYGISAEHGRNYGDLMEAVSEHLPRQPAQRPSENLVRVAVLGKPNAGKSTLVNRILGEKRLLTSDVPGTTRDAINTFLEHDGQRYLFVDTAGIRRKRAIHAQVEKFAVVQAFKAIDRVDVVIYVIDATEGVSTQDQRLCGLIHDKGRALVLLLNKWDLIEKDHKTAAAFIQKLRDDLHFCAYAPVITASALTGQRIHRLFPLVRLVHTEYMSRISTGRLNEYLREAIRRNPPRAWSNQRLKIYYCTQVAVAPPTFMIVVNDDRIVHFSYQRYLVNSLRRQFGFEGTPVKVFFRGRKRDDAAHEMT